jgi:hypothetical protein
VFHIELLLLLLLLLTTVKFNYWPAAEAARHHHLHCACQHQQGLAGTAGSSSQHQPASSADINHHKVPAQLDQLL